MSTENIESQQIREVAEWMPDNFTVSLPTSSVADWGDVGYTKKDVEFVDVNLSELLGFIADMTE